MLWRRCPVLHCTHGVCVCVATPQLVEQLDTEGYTQFLYGMNLMHIPTRVPSSRADSIHSARRPSLTTTISTSVNPIIRPMVRRQSLRVDPSTGNLEGLEDPARLKALAGLPRTPPSALQGVRRVE